MDIDEEDGFDIRFGTEPHPTRRDVPDWNRTSDMHSARALVTAERLFKLLDKSKLNEIQIEIIRISILIGTHRAACEFKRLNTHDYMKYFKSLDYIIPDKGNREENIILKAFHLGLTLKSGRNKDPSRQFLHMPLYTHVEKLLDEHDAHNGVFTTSNLIKLTNDIFDLWNEVVETTDFGILVCYNNFIYNIDDLRDIFSREVPRTEEHGKGNPMTFEDFLIYHHNHLGISIQDSVNIWDKEWFPISGGIPNPGELGLLPLQPDEMISDNDAMNIDGGGKTIMDTLYNNFAGLFK